MSRLRSWQSSCYKLLDARYLNLRRKGMIEEVQCRKGQYMDRKRVEYTQQSGLNNPRVR